MKYIIAVFSSGLLILLALPSLLAEFEEPPHDHAVTTIFYAHGHKSARVVYCLPDSQIVRYDSDHWTDIKPIVNPE